MKQNGGNTFIIGRVRDTNITFVSYFKDRSQIVHLSGNPALVVVCGVYWTCTLLDGDDELETNSNLVAFTMGRIRDPLPIWILCLQVRLQNIHLSANTASVILRERELT
jgi:hypothetical protein